MGVYFFCYFFKGILPRIFRCITMYQRHQTGQHGEQLAAAYLLKNGYTIIETNYRTRWGEIDIITRVGSTIHFFEVKTRYSTRHGHPFEAVSQRKRLKIQRAAWAYLLAVKPTYSALAIGVVGIQLTRDSQAPVIQHIGNIGW